MCYLGISTNLIAGSGSGLERSHKYRLKEENRIDTSFLGYLITPCKSFEWTLQHIIIGETL